MVEVIGVVLLVLAVVAALLTRRDVPEWFS